MATGTDEPLRAHLLHRLGAWPPRQGLQVVGSPDRLRPGWDGTVADVVGVLRTADGVVSVPPAVAGPAADLVGGRGLEALDDLLAALPSLVGRPGGRPIVGVFRHGTELTDLPDAGTWVSPSDPVVPPWLRPFADPVLVAVDGDGRYLAGVGRKVHDHLGQEIAVGTEPAARGRGLARRLVAQAARRIVADGAVVTYLHAADNTASAQVAAAAGFPDIGWRCVAVTG